MDAQRPLNQFVAASAALGVTILVNEPLARHTTFRIGGPADLHAAVHTVELLEQLVELATAHEIPITVLGGGSNVLISDAGVRGLVIANQTRDFGLRTANTVAAVRHWRHGLANANPPSDAAPLVADSGVPLAGLARWAIRAGWAGLEWAVSVPGSVGGAVIGNAGAHGRAIADTLAWALVLSPGQGQRVLTADDLQFAYRSSLLKKQVGAWGPGSSERRVDAPPVVLAAGFLLTPGDAAGMRARAETFLARRRASQPTEPSAGSVFRNPPGDFAGRLIEAVGLKGHCIGGAQVSPLHANFIVNTGGARAADVLDLINLTRTRVDEQFGIELMPEIVFVGDWAGQPAHAAVKRAGAHPQRAAIDSGQPFSNYILLSRQGHDA